MTIMSEEWLNFKSYMDGSNVSAVYIDNGGNEMPIESECDFQKAISLAKLNKKRLKIILYCKKSEPCNTVTQNDCEHFDTIPLGPPESVKKETMLQDSLLKEHNCQCKGDVPPEWFIHHMKKFKRELLHDLKLNLGDIIHSVIEKENKTKLKGETVDLTSGKIEATLMAAQGKKKKKGSEKDLGDFLDQREVKLAKKIEKLQHTKFEKLEKLDNKTRALLEDRRRLMERKRHSKLTKTNTNYGLVSEKEVLRKSASFVKNEVCIFLPPNAEFVVTVNFTNNGVLRWEAPWLECFELNGLYLEEERICLPRLLPMESGYTVLRGRVCKNKGLQHFKCRIFDGLEKFGPEFTCWAKVDVDKPVKKLLNSESFDERKMEDSVDVLIDFEKDEFTATRKKIEQNINEIERRLQDIDFLRPSTVADDTLKKNKLDFEMTENLATNGCNSLQNSKGREKNWKEKLEQEGVYFGVDCLHMASSSSNEKISKVIDENSRNEQPDKRSESGRSSDSELSVIFMSEEDENFIVVPVPSKSPSPAESVDEDKKFSRIDSEDSEDYHSGSREKMEPFLQQSLESPKAKASEKASKEAVNTSENLQWQLSPLKNRRSPFEEVSKSKPKKIKPSSTEYRFTAAHLIQPTFTLVPERLEERPSKFTFTGEKEEKKTLLDTVFEWGLSKHISSETKDERKSPAEGVFEKRPCRQNSSEDKDYRKSPAEDVFEKWPWRQNSSEDKDYRKSPAEDVFEKWPWRQNSSEDKNERKSPAEGVFEKRPCRQNSSEDKNEKKSPAEGVFEKRPCRQNSSEDKEERKSPTEGAYERRRSKQTFTENNEKKSQTKEGFRGKKIATTDSTGKVIYAVKSNGYCFPVEDLLDGGDHWKIPSQESDSFRKKEARKGHQKEKRYDRFNEVPAVNVLPSILMTGASNAASIAFNTAKSVFNNLHSAFVEEGKTELGKPACESRKKAPKETLSRLFEMGFTDFELNEKLLFTHDNNLERIVEELIEICKNSSKPQP